jgi:hypothetical protein
MRGGTMAGMDEKQCKLPDDVPPSKDAWPLWVCWAIVAYPSKRSRDWTVGRIIAIGGMLFVGILLFWGNPSLMGLFILAAMTFGMVHTYLAVRWVDQHDGWRN